ncbi:hypothetical protein ACHAWU_006586 [Discostella pseudostelligera]|uniref:Acylphosphatase-like domain-containing protein n=1 Tax=Discostella pseudostelligera TaxID=259834 RepID=A0ABD3M7W3_9STRA
MMCHQQLLSIVSLFISLLAFLSGGGHIVHGFTTPVRGTVTVVGTSPIPHRTAKSLDTNNYRTPLLKALHLLPPRVITPSSVSIPTTTTGLQAEPTSDGDNSNNDANELIARRIIVVGDVDGGYYRSCVKNEASRFRKLIGTMSPPAGEKRAEIYVELNVRGTRFSTLDHLIVLHQQLVGKRKMVEGFVRWCERGDVGLSQSIKVDSVIDEFPTGLYDEFYVSTGRE